MQAISPLSLHITFFYHNHTNDTANPNDNTPPNHKTRDDCHCPEHTTPLQNHSQMWSHKHWATSPLVAWQPYMLTDEGQWQTLTMNNQQECCTTNDNICSTQTSLKDQMNPSWSMASGDGSVGLWLGNWELLHAGIPRKGYGSIKHNVSCCWSFLLLLHCYWISTMN